MEKLSKENIIDFVEQINSVDTDNIKPMAHPLNISQRLRNDDIELVEPDQQDLF